MNKYTCMGYNKSSIEPLLLSLENGGVKVQGHADDTALSITTSSQAVYASKTLTGYERASIASQ